MLLRVRRRLQRVHHQEDRNGRRHHGSGQWSPDCF
jgi:hypothetical protein